MQHKIFKLLILENDRHSNEKRGGEKPTLIQVEVHSSNSSNSLAFACFIKYCS